MILSMELEYASLSYMSLTMPKLAIQLAPFIQFIRGNRMLARLSPICIIGAKTTYTYYALDLA